MSRETTEALGVRRRMEHEWREHSLNCSQCGMAKARRRPAERCRSGAALYAALQTATALVKVNRELDAQPIPGQGTLI